MKLWLDAQLSPRIAEWLTATFELEATAVRDLGLRESEDEERGILHSLLDEALRLLEAGEQLVEISERQDGSAQ